MKSGVSRVLLFILLFGIALFPKDGSKDKNIAPSKNLSQVKYSFLDINNLFVPLSNIGFCDNYDAPSHFFYFTFPKGTQKNASFMSGILWGGIVPGDTVPRIGGSDYRTGLQPGAILSNGHADDPSLDKYRIYRVRQDVKPGGPSIDLSIDAANEYTTADALTAQYLKDWNEWPASLGAPFTDVNNNGIYEPNIDIPGVPGADQTLWFVANDLDSSKTVNLCGTQPIGIEMQVTYWAYSRQDAMGDMFFRKCTIINKGFQHITVNKMFISMWADVDLGYNDDDYVGADSLLNLQFCYNAAAVDPVYSPLPPPCLGFDFLQGPLVHGIAGQDLNKNGIDDAIDFGIYNGKKMGPGLINLPMTADYYYSNGIEPPLDIRGASQFYNYFQGKYSYGSPFIDPTTGKITTFALCGDPVSKHGWVDGMNGIPGDRRQGSSSGPFTFAPGDTQEVVIAEMVAGAVSGVDHISAVGLCKYYVAQAQTVYNNFFNLPFQPPRAKC